MSKSKFNKMKMEMPRIGDKVTDLYGKTVVVAHVGTIETCIAARNGNTVAVIGNRPFTLSDSELIRWLADGEAAEIETVRVITLAHVSLTIRLSQNPVAFTDDMAMAISEKVAKIKAMNAELAKMPPPHEDINNLKSGYWDND